MDNKVKEQLIEYFNQISIALYMGTESFDYLKDLAFKIMVFAADNDVPNLIRYSEINYKLFNTKYNVSNSQKERSFNRAQKDIRGDISMVISNI